MKLPQNYVPGEGVRKATGYGGKGQRMLELMGWCKGQGLGPEKDGMREALETKEKKDTAGVGANQGWDWTAKFWEDSYNSMAGQIQDDNASSSGDEVSSGDIDEEDAVTVARKQRRSSGAAASSSSSSSDSDEPANLGRTKESTPKTISNKKANSRGASPAENGLAEGAGARGNSVERVGWRGRAGKLARIAQHEAAEAARLAALLEGTDQKPQQQGAAGGGTSGGAQVQHGDAAKKRNKACKRIVLTLSLPEDPRIKPMAFKPTPATGWWGAGYFRSNGAMGGVEEETAKAEEDKEATEQKLGFDEDDQAALYMQAHNNQRRGHTGLGQSTRSLRIAGGNWEGSKTRFEENDEEGVQGNGTGVGGDSDVKGDGKESGGKKKKKKKKEKRAREIDGGDWAEQGQERDEKGGKKGKKKKQKEGAEEGGEEGAGDDLVNEAGKGNRRRAKAGKKKGDVSKETSQAEDAAAAAAAAGSSDGQVLDGKRALKLAKSLIQEAPDQRIRLGKLCARVAKLQGGCQEALSALMLKKAKKSMLMVKDGYVHLLPEPAVHA